MARGFSKAIITGNLVQDPELRSTPSGSQVCSFAVAVNDGYRTKDGNNVDSVSYIDCVAWNKAGEIISQYAKKGSGILVSGRLRQDRFEDKQGNKRSRLSVVVEDFNFLNGRDNANNSGASASSSASAASDRDVAPKDIPDEAINLDEIPF